MGAAGEFDFLVVRPRFFVSTSPATAGRFVAKVPATARFPGLGKSCWKKWCTLDQFVPEQAPLIHYLRLTTTLLAVSAVSSLWPVQDLLMFVVTIMQLALIVGRDLRTCLFRTLNTLHSGFHSGGNFESEDGKKIT